MRIDPRARTAFEFFCFRSAEMRDELDRFRRLAASRQCLVDVGAHYGLFTLVFLQDRPQATALAIEPLQAAREILRSNLELNGLGRVPIVPVAVGADNGSVDMWLNQHHLEAASPESKGDGSRSLPTRSLDSLCAGHRLAPDLIKIDVEGFELEVIRGATRTLSLHRCAVMLELHPYLLERRRQSPGEVTGLLENLGYEAWTLGGRTIPWKAVASVGDVSRIVCLPRDLDEAVAP